MTRVTVYPSDYGLERMAEEAALGPQKIFKVGSGGGAIGAAKAAPVVAAAAAGKKGKKGKKDEEGESEEASEEEEEEENDIDKKRLAMYEKSKLRYYYAVVRLGRRGE